MIRLYERFPHGSGWTRILEQDLGQLPDVILFGERAFVFSGYESQCGSPAFPQDEPGSTYASHATYKEGKVARLTVTMS